MILSITNCKSWIFWINRAPSRQKIFYSPVNQGRCGWHHRHLPLSAFFLFLLCLFLLFCCFQWFFLLGFLCILGLCHTGFLLKFFIYRYCSLFPYDNGHKLMNSASCFSSKPTPNTPSNLFETTPFSKKSTVG